MIKKILLLSLLFLGKFTFAQIPAGYYDNAIGDTGITMKIALHNIIKGHTVVSYSSLHTHFQVTDKRPDGKVWDMYSDIPGGTPPYEFTFITDKCGNYQNEGDCYNREHSFPQSWFSSASPMKSDLFHVYPTDGKVNGKRSNYPYGDVGTPTWTSLNGSKLGPSVSPGYSGTVFEPIDAYKGDFARSYFYMAVRYYSEDGSWPGSVSTNGAEPKPWALNLLYQWHLQDTVSQKEIDRNNAVYGIQNNRNPFIDHPEWVDTIWFYSASSPSSIDASYQELDAVLAPNPVENQSYLILLNHQQKHWLIDIYDIQGRLVAQTTGETNRILLNTQSLEAGTYILNIHSADMKLNKNLKFIKQ